MTRDFKTNYRDFLWREKNLKEQYWNNINESKCQKQEAFKMILNKSLAVINEKKILYFYSLEKEKEKQLTV